jgi:hypothetical protein
MPLNLRALAARDLETTIEGEFGSPVTLTDPDGKIVSETADGRPLTGRVLYTRTENNADGEPVSVKKPSVLLRWSSLSRHPKTGEVWGIEIPAGPDTPHKKMCLLDKNYAVEGSNSIGTIRLALVWAEEAAP